MVLFAIIVAACGLAGLIVGRWSALAFPAVAWTGIVLFLGRNNGWYGAGWGDGGIVFNVVVAALSFAAAGAGVAARAGRRRAADGHHTEARPTGRL